MTLTTEEARNILFGNRLTIRDKSGTVTRHELDAPAIEHALTDLFGLPFQDDWRRIIARIGSIRDDLSAPTT